MGAPLTHITISIPIVSPAIQAIRVILVLREGKKNIKITILKGILIKAPREKVSKMAVSKRMTDNNAPTCFQPRTVNVWYKASRRTMERNKASGGAALEME